MSGGSAPLRFLALAVGGWICVRAAVLAPGWWVERGEAAPARSSPPPRTAAEDMRTGAERPPVPHGEVSWLPRRQGASRFDEAPSPAPVPSTVAAASLARERLVTATSFDQPAAAQLPPAVASLARQSPSRWSTAAWMLVRGGDGGAALTPGGTLGGSQAGVRVSYRLSGDGSAPLSLVGRLYAPLRGRGAESAIGLDWRPLAGVPVNLLVERRQALGGNGRSAFAATVYGGAGAPLPAGFRLDSYAQAGVVGLRSRDLFADGSARVSLPLGRLEVGAGAWAAAQPGAARLDAGPHVALRLPAAGGDLRLQADWRFRLAGDAAPGSGPALTLSTDF